MKEKRIPKTVLYINLETTIMRGRPRNGWQNEVREDGRIWVLKGGKIKYITEKNGRRS
jgi:hypothetical protein